MENERKKRIVQRIHIDVDARIHYRVKLAAMRRNIPMTLYISRLIVRELAKEDELNED